MYFFVNVTGHLRARPHVLGVLLNGLGGFANLLQTPTILSLRQQSDEGEGGIEQVLPIITPNPLHLPPRHLKQFVSHILQV